VSTGFNRVEGTRRASRNGPPERPHLGGLGGGSGGGGGLGLGGVGGGDGGDGGLVGGLGGDGAATYSSLQLASAGFACTRGACVRATVCCAGGHSLTHSPTHPLTHARAQSVDYLTPRRAVHDGAALLPRHVARRGAVAFLDVVVAREPAVRHLEVLVEAARDDRHLVGPPRDLACDLLRGE
jgi:hypothetical protein